MKQNIKCFLITVFLIAVYSIHVHAADPMLKWNASTGDVSGYTIYYGLSQGNYPFSEDVGNVTQYSLSNFSLSEGTTYYFVVRASNTSGESGDSNVTTYSVPDTGDTTPPFSPQSVAGKIVNNNIVLTWQANSESDFSVYRVYYGTSSRDYGLPIPVNGTEYSISGLNSGVTYYLAVTAVDTAGNESGYSSPEIQKTIMPEAVVSTIPDTTTNPWIELTNDNFESGWGNFKSGGRYCIRLEKFIMGHQSKYSIRIQQNEKRQSSLIYRSGLDVKTPDYSQIKIEFRFLPIGMDKKDKFFVEYYDGHNWQKVAKYKVGKDFTNGSFYHEQGIIINKGQNLTFPKNMRIRFRSASNRNIDKIFIDDVIVSAR